MRKKKETRFYKNSIISHKLGFYAYRIGKEKTFLFKLRNGELMVTGEEIRNFGKSLEFNLG